MDCFAIEIWQSQDQGCTAGDEYFIARLEIYTEIYLDNRLTGYVAAALIIQCNRGYARWRYARWQNASQMPAGDMPAVALSCQLKPGEDLLPVVAPGPGGASGGDRGGDRGDAWGGVPGGGQGGARGGAASILLCKVHLFNRSWGAII